VTSENPPSSRPVRVAHLQFGRDMLVSPKGDRFAVVDGGETDRGMFVWLLPIGPDGFGIPGARRRRLYQDGTDGWTLDTPRRPGRPADPIVPAAPSLEQTPATVPAPGVKVQSHATGHVGIISSMTHDGRVVVQFPADRPGRSESVTYHLSEINPGSDALASVVPVDSAGNVWQSWEDARAASEASTPAAPVEPAPAAPAATEPLWIPILENAPAADEPEIETGPGFPVACTSVHEHDPEDCAPESPLAMMSAPDAILSTWTMAVFPASPNRAQAGEVTIVTSDFRAFLGHLSVCGFKVGPGNGEPEGGPEEVDGLPLYAFAAGPTGSLVFRRELVDFHPGGFPRAAAGPDSTDTPDRYDVRPQSTPAGMAYGVLDTATGNIAHVAWGIETAGWYDDRAGARAAADQLSAAWRAAGGWSTGHYLPPSASVIVRGPAGPEKWTGEKWNRHLDAASGADQGISYTITRWY